MKLKIALVYKKSFVSVKVEEHLNENEHFCCIVRWDKIDSDVKWELLENSEEIMKFFLYKK